MPPSASAADTRLQWRVVQLVNGTLVTGYCDLHAWKFQGIRYAEPPARFGYAKKAVFTLGSPDGTNLASRGNVVVVSVSYHVGNSGFLAFDDGVRHGNYALSDIMAASTS